jgi:hypothetical protein
LKISDEIKKFDDDMAFVLLSLAKLANAEPTSATQEDLFSIESLAFRTFRASERLIRAVFLEGCASATTPSGTKVASKVRSSDHRTVEEVLKAGNRFLDWGNIAKVRTLANLVFDNGFPVIDVVDPINSDLTDLQKIRNFIAHDSDEAKSGFDQVVASRLVLSPNPPDSAGKLLLSRRSINRPRVAKTLFTQIDKMTSIYVSI